MVRDSVRTNLAFLAGRPYMGLVHESLRNVGHLAGDEGIMIRRGSKPMDLDQLEGVTLGFPSRLLARAVEDPHLKKRGGRWHYRGRPAEFIPPLDRRT